MAIAPSRVPEIVEEGAPGAVVVRVRRGLSANLTSRPPALPPHGSSKSFFEDALYGPTLSVAGAPCTPTAEIV